MNALITIENCKNCGQHVENHNFCPNCGAKKITNRITPKHLISEFIERFFNLDNSFIRTFIHLFTKPEEVIGGYINGLRKRYIHAFGYFAISATIMGFYSFVVKGRLGDLMTNPLNSSLSMEQIETQNSIVDFIFQYQTLLNFLLIPILALLSRIVFLNYKKYNLTEHLVIYLYAYSHIISLMAIIVLPFIFFSYNLTTITLIQFSGYIIYVAFVLKRLYSINLKKILLKTLLFIILGGVSYIILILIAFLIMLLIGVVEPPFT